MAGNVSTFAAGLSPGKWDSDPASPEENLRTFTEWIEEFERWLDICGLQDQTDQQKWALVIATGKNDMKQGYRSELDREERLWCTDLTDRQYQPMLMEKAEWKNRRK